MNCLQPSEASLIRLKQTFYGYGEKSGRLLAWQIKQLQSSKAINNIYTTAGNLTSDPVDINKTFLLNFSNCYILQNLQDGVWSKPYF